MGNSKLGFDTLKVRGGYDSKDHNRAAAVPIYQTASFDIGSTERAKNLFEFSEFGFLYSRTNNPTAAALEQRVAALDGGVAAVAVGSGMAALTYTLLNVTEGQGRILTTRQVYGGTFDSFKKVYPQFGVVIDQVKNSSDLDEFRRAVKPDTKAIFIETISNPNAVVADIEALAAIAHEHNIPLIVDNTIATPYLLNPFHYGADIIIYSATKALSGHGNVIAGIIVEGGNFNWANGKFPQFLEPNYTLRTADGRERSYLEVFPDSPFSFRVRRNYLAYFGAALSPFDAYLALLGIETLSERVQKQVANTVKIIRYLETKTGVSWIKHPAAKNSPYKALAEKYLPKGAGSILSFGFNGTEQQRFKFIDSVHLFGYQANIGDAKSLIINSPKTTHGELTPQEQELADITADTIRLSLGLEDADDLIADLDQAFTKAFA